MGALEDRYQVDLSETSFAAVKTVAILEHHLQGKLPPRVKVSLSSMGAALAHNLDTASSFITCSCVRQFFCWAGRELKGGKICADSRAPVLVVCNHIDDVDVGLRSDCSSCSLTS